MRRNNQKNDDFNKKGLSVEVRNNDVNGALRKLKKKLQEDGILQEVRDRQHFVKPSLKRKKEKAAGRARWLKKVAKQKENW